MQISLTSSPSAELLGQDIDMFHDARLIACQGFWAETSFPGSTTKFVLGQGSLACH